jgi:hypothetical protein
LNDELYSKDDVLAFQRVGEFLCWFSMLETKIDESIIGLLGLDPLAGRLLLTYVPFARKPEFLGELICLEDVGFTPTERNEAKSRLGEIHKKSQIRNIVAHSFFSGEQGAVKFMKAKKKLRADTSQTINEEAFQKHRTDMVDLWGWVAQISHRIKVKMSDKQIAEAMTERLSQPFSKLN